MPRSKSKPAPGRVGMDEALRSVESDAAARDAKPAPDKAKRIRRSPDEIANQKEVAVLDAMRPAAATIAGVADWGCKTIAIDIDPMLHPAGYPADASFALKEGEVMALENSLCIVLSRFPSEAVNKWLPLITVFATMAGIAVPRVVMYMKVKEYAESVKQPGGTPAGPNIPPPTGAPGPTPPEPAAPTQQSAH